MHVKYNIILILYLLSSLFGFFFYWYTANVMYTFPSRFLLVLSFIIAFAMYYYTEKKINMVLSFAVTLILVLKLSYDAIESNFLTIFLLKATFINIVFNFLLGFALISNYQMTSKYSKATITKVVFILTLVLIPILIIMSGVTWYETSHTADLYQSFASYYYRIIVVLSILYVIKIDDDKLSHDFMFMSIYFFAFLFCIYTGAKKEILLCLVAFPFIIVRILLKITQSSIFTLAIFIVCIIFVVYSVGSMNEAISNDYMLSLVSRSITDRIDIIVRGFIPMIERYPWLGNHFAHEEVGTLYIHSTPLNLFTSFGLILGPIIFTTIAVTFLRHVHFTYFGVCAMGVFAIATVATAYDWMLAWFTLGCCRGLHSNNRYSEV